MGCYVYVNRSMAELYQIKREDEFDAVDTDPVNDYRIYMENMHIRQDNPVSEPYDNEAAAKPNVNYMYINSGVPVIVYNYGANPKRDKDLRILLVERATGFCMWEFKFDWLTQFENLNNITVVRLAFNNKTVHTNLTGESGLGLFQSKLATSANTFNYQNEYFEKFFNSKNRHAHKEHLLKFIDKFDCDEFCFTKINIMSKNSELFTLDKDFKNYSHLDEKEFGNNELLPQPPPPIETSSSVIICHFDFLTYNCVLANKTNSAESLKNTEFKRNGSNQSLTDLTLKKPFVLSRNKSMEERDDQAETGLKKKYSISSSNIMQTDSLSTMIKRKLFGSYYSIEDEPVSRIANENNILKTIKKIKNFSKSSSTGTQGASTLKVKKLRKSDIGAPVNFSHVTHLDKPVPIGRRYKLNYKS